ncbi:MAG: type I secretion system permease/ATPase [Magnetospiraceae bacterium]
MKVTAKTVLNRSRSLFLLVGVISLFVNVLTLTVPMFMLQSFDRVLPSRSTDTLVMLALIAMFALTIYGVLEAIRSRVLVAFADWFDKELGVPTFKSSVRSAALFQKGGDAQSLRDVNSLKNFLAGAGIIAFFDAPWVPFFLFVVYAIHPVQGMIATAGAVILFGLALLNEFLTRRPIAEAASEGLANNRAAEMAVRNAEAVDAMGMMSVVAGRWEETQRKVTAIQQTASNRGGAIAAASKSFRFMVQAAILASGLSLVLGHELTSGGMIAGSIIMARALAPVEQLIQSWKQFVGARNAYMRLNKNLERPLDLRTETEYPAPEGKLTAEGVTFGFPGQGAPILKGVTFGVFPGEVVGIVGPSGAGKSCLARILLGIWPATGGKARLDGIDMFTWNRENLGSHIGYVPQDVELFSGTVKENIARLGNATDEEIIAAAQAANAHEMIAKLSKGYDTPVGDGGQSLSGGQRQRIALARALLRDPKLLILDEPNASLDQEGNVALIQALRAAKKRGASVVVISHRPEVLQVADRVVLLVAGQVQAIGPREQVMGQIQQANRQALQARRARQIKPNSADTPSDGDAGDPADSEMSPVQSAQG